MLAGWLTVWRWNTFWVFGFSMNPPPPHPIDLGHETDLSQNVVIEEGGVRGRGGVVK